MDNTLFVIDAMAYAFRSFYAIRTALSDAQGRPTNAVYGFTRILLKIIREHQPSHLAVVFDAPGKNFRDEWYPEYKATRPDTPEALKTQFPMMHTLVEAMNIPLFVVPGVEADDVMGALACQAEKAGMDTVLVSGDKDLLQLVTDRVRVFDPAKGDTGTWYDPDAVAERFGAPPEHVVDVLALMGDSADNVPGVRGVGEKTAKKLMAKYTSLEGLYENISELKGKQKERVTEDREQAFFSRKLVTIKTDLELPLPLEDLVRKKPDPEILTRAFEELKFQTLLEELLPAQQKEPEAADYRLLLTEEDIENAISEMRAAKKFAVDTETTSVNPMRAELVGVSMSCQSNTGYYIPVAHLPEALTIFTDPDDLTTATQLNPVPKAKALALLKPLLEDASIGKIGHNIKYDLIVFARAGIALQGIVMDTMIASYLTDPSRLRHNLNEVSLQYLRHKPIPISNLIGKGAKAVTFDHVPVDRACEYASEDADLAWRLAQVLEPKLEECALTALFHEVELPLIGVLASMEQTGIALEGCVFDELSKTLEARQHTLEEEIFQCAGETFNLNSPKQLQHILFTQLGLKPLRKTKTGYSTDVDVLEQLAHTHELPGMVLEYRQLEKLRSTYVDALPKLVHPQTQRIHTSFNQAVTATGRLSSSEPNLQNIPVRTEYGRRIRAGFVPGASDRQLISADYSQIELRVLAHLSHDENLCAAFVQDADVHRDTAARVFGVAEDAVTPALRRQAKAVNFGVIYGISPYGLARNLGISNAEASRFIDAYFAQYPRVKEWLDETLAEAKQTGYVTTLLHRRRYIPELASSAANVRKGAERVAINTPVQGSAADMIKLAMLHVAEALKTYDAQLLLQVHDELIIEVARDQASQVAEIVKECMENALPLDVPLKVDLGIGQNWAEIH